MVLANCKIISMADHDFGCGFIRICGGKIVEIGSMVDFSLTKSKNEEVINICGKTVVPGFIDAHTHLGLGKKDLQGFGYALDAADIFGKDFADAFRAGTTTASISPGSAKAVGGFVSVVKTNPEDANNMFNQKAAVKFSLGENVPQSRMQTAFEIRETLCEACKNPEKNLKNKSLQALFEGKISVHFHAHSAQDILTAVRISNEFGIKFVIVHGTEAYKIVRTLKKEKCQVIVGPLISDRSKKELENFDIKNIKILHENGIKFAIASDHPEVPSWHLPLCLSLAKTCGIDKVGALKAVTISAAEILGISDCVGSLEKGKDADILVFDGDPLEAGNLPQMVIAGGEVFKNE
jgi:imidazolonepropionase-like amidohydrolase